MGILDRLKKAREQSKLFKQLKNAPQEELLKAIETNPESYDVVIKVLRKRALKLDYEWDYASNLVFGRKSELNYVRNKYKEFEPLVSKCFSAIIERAPEYVKEINRFNRRLFNKIKIHLSANVLKSIHPFEANNATEDIKNMTDEQRKENFATKKKLMKEHPIMVEPCLNSMCESYVATKDEAIKKEMLSELYELRKGGDNNSEKREMAKTFKRVLDRNPDLQKDENLVALSKIDTPFTRPTKRIKEQVTRY